MRRRFVGEMGLAAVCCMLIVLGGTASAASSDAPSWAASHLAPLPDVSITFAANSTAEVNSLLTTVRPYIESGDSFDLVSGSPASKGLSITNINHWASLLRTAFPTAEIFAQTAGIAHFTTLAWKASANISGIFYDYEPGYEPEFTANFPSTVSEFNNVTAVAHAHGLLSIGYPTGLPISSPRYKSDDWNYAALASAVDRLDIQTQAHCHDNTSSFSSALEKVLGQFANASDTDLPTFQVTLGVNLSLTPNQVTPLQAYNCTQVLTQDGLRALYLWWGPASSSDVVRFLKDIGRSPTS